MSNADAADVAANVAHRIRADVEDAQDTFLAASDYVADALEARYVVTGSGNVTEMHLVVGTGGPHVEVRHRIGTEAVEVYAWWWSDFGSCYAYAPALSAELDRHAEAWSDAAVLR